MFHHLFDNYWASTFLILLALYNIKNIVKAKGRVAKVTHGIISLTLNLCAIGYGYILHQLHSFQML